MQAYRAHTMVERNGSISIKNLPFKQGTFVEVVLVEETSPDAKVTENWKKSNKRIQRMDNSINISEKEIRYEVNECRKRTLR
jgi:hypothetical protein